MQPQLHTDTIRKNILAGLAMGGALVTTGCETPEPASLENANRSELDYGKIDYSKLDYSKLDQNRVQEQFGEVCDITKVESKVIGEEMAYRLEYALKLAQEKQMPKDVISFISKELDYVVAGNKFFQEHDLCW